MKLRRGLLVTASVLVAAAINLLPWPAAWAERLYLQVLLPGVTGLTAPAVNAVGFSVSGLLALGLVSVPLVVLVLGGRSRLGGVLRFWGTTLIGLALLFPLTFGLGYRLPGLAARQVAGRAELTEPMREELGAHVLGLLRSSSEAWRSREVGAGASSVFTAESVAAAAECVARLTNELRVDYPQATVPTRVKLLPAGLLLRSGFAGVVSPWLLEPHVDAGLPSTAALAVALHELAHSAGFASEAEAEAVGVIAGLECADQRVVYAAALRLARVLAGALAADERAAYVTAWPAAARADAAASARAVERYGRAGLTSGAGAAYELYLKSQGEQGGLAEYGRGAELALQLLHARSLAMRPDASQGEP